MAKSFTPQIVTANDLMLGDVIYLTASHTWSRAHEEAAVASDPESAEALLAAAQGQALKTVGPYLANATLDAAGRPAPIHFREAFRTRGPSNYVHGKQESL